MNRRELMQMLGTVLTAPLNAAPGSPNVLFFISDQLYHSALGVAGNPIIKTPNIDGLARSGVRFAQAICPTPFCSPSRATMLTGLYPHKHRITYNVGDPAKGLDPKLPSTENVLFPKGYQCGQKGKWHLGDKTNLPPYAKDPELDYAEFLGDTKRSARRSFTMIPVVEKALARYDREKGINIGKSSTPIAKQQESWIADTAIRQMQSFAGKPFCMTVSFPAPHAPWIINEPYYSMYERARFQLPPNRSVEDVDRDSPSRAFGELLGDEGFREYLAVYYGMVSMMDWNTGRVLDALRKMGQERNTLVVFMADHGDMQAGHSMYGKLTKLMYEETTRIPLIMSFPGRMPAGKVVQTQAGTADVSPTILDYLGYKPSGPIHGRSLRSYIDGKEDLERPIYSEHERGAKDFQRMIRTMQWKYAFSFSGSSQLYNLEKDPGETRNLINDAGSKSIKQKLHTQLTQWMRETDDPRSAQMG